MSISEEFKNRINDLFNEELTKRKIKKTELIILIDVDYSSLSNALEYGIMPTPRILIRIADYFNVPLDYLLGYSDIDKFEKSKLNEDLWTRIQILSKLKGWDSHALNIQCHFPRGYVERWIKLKYIPSLKNLETMADVFEVSLDYLLGRTDY